MDIVEKNKKLANSFFRLCFIGYGRLVLRSVSLLTFFDKNKKNHTMLSAQLLKPHTPSPHHLPSRLLIYLENYLLSQKKVTLS